MESIISNIVVDRGVDASECSVAESLGRDFTKAKLEAASYAPQDVKGCMHRCCNCNADKRCVI